YEDVRRASFGTEYGVILVRANPDRLSRDRHGKAEIVHRGAVRSEKLLLLGPRRARAHEHIGRAGPQEPFAMGDVRAHHDGVARDRYGGAESVDRLPIR